MKQREPYFEKDPEYSNLIMVLMLMAAVCSWTAFLTNGYGMFILTAVPTLGAIWMTTIVSNELKENNE